MRTDPILWTRLQEFASAESLTGLEAKAAALLGLPPDQGPAVVREYLRFLYLTETSVMQSRPSPPLFAIWEAHGKERSNSWEQFLATVSQNPRRYTRMKHPESSQRDALAYEETRAHYRAEFGEEPPAALWPDITIPDYAERSRAGPRMRDEVLSYCFTTLAIAVPAVGLLIGQPLALCASIFALCAGAALFFSRRSRSLNSLRFSLFRPSRRRRG